VPGIRTMWATAVLASALVRSATELTNVAPIATGGNGGDGGGEGGGGEGEGGGGEGGGWACCSSRRWLGMRGVGSGIRTGGGGGIGGQGSDTCCTRYILAAGASWLVLAASANTVMPEGTGGGGGHVPQRGSASGVRDGIGSANRGLRSKVGARHGCAADAKGAAVLIISA
jgi:hypothetical protein